jgi:hypothetical protein
MGTKLAVYPAYNEMDGTFRICIIISTSPKVLTAVCPFPADPVIYTPGRYVSLGKPRIEYEVVEDGKEFSYYCCCFTNHNNL